MTAIYFHNLISLSFLFVVMWERNVKRIRMKNPVGAGFLSSFVRSGVLSSLSHSSVALSVPFSPYAGRGEWGGLRGEAKQANNRHSCGRSLSSLGVVSHSATLRSLLHLATLGSDEDEWNEPQARGTNPGRNRYEERTQMPGFFVNMSSR